MSNYDPPSKFPSPPTSITPFRQPVNPGPEPWDNPKIEPLGFLLSIMRASSQPMDRRMDAARAAAPFTHRVKREAKTDVQAKKQA